MLLNYLLRPCRLDYLHPFLIKKGVKVLDIGCGNNSPSITKKYYPDCLYYGLNQSKSYNLNEVDFKSMEQFYEIDLSCVDNLNVVPDDFFDCIIFSHVVEHLNNGYEVMEELIKKLKSTGVIYIETPSQMSIHFPRMKGPLLGGCLNFYDDPSHVKPYDVKIIENLLKERNFTIMRSGIRRSLKRIIFFPVYFIGSFIYFRYLDGCVFWDILGFVEQIIAVKKVE